MKRAILLTLGLVLLAPSTALAGHRHHHHKPPPPFRVLRKTVLGHQVTMVTYIPGHKMKLRATFSRVRRSPLAWGSVVGGLATMNADTWQWATNVPNGPLRIAGSDIVRNPVDRPAVGFYSTGGVVFSAQAARKHHASYIVSGPAYLVRAGHVAHSFPWAHSIQITCGVRGTDGPGCWRSNVVQWPGGKVGLVEIAFASMPTAGRILHRLGVQNAITFDSGGSSVLGWRHRTTARWAQAGIQHAIGSTWLRPVPEAVVMVRR